MNEYEYEIITLLSYEKILTDYICMLCWAKFLEEIVGRYFRYEEQCSYNELYKLLFIAFLTNLMLFVSLYHLRLYEIILPSIGTSEPTQK